jgi:FHS family L-fucose permease-like MFS transporter
LIPGLNSGNYALILLAFFIIGTGFNFELVAGNPLLSGLGETSGSSSRLNLGNALGAIAQIIAPLIILLILPATVVSVADKIPYMNGLFLAIAVILVITGMITLVLKDERVSFEASKNTPKDESGSIWKNKKLLLGFIAIFIALGAESGIFGLYRNYLEDPAIAALSSHQSYILYTIYFATFAVGRLVGAYVQKRINPALTLIYGVIAAMILLLVMMMSTGIVAVVAITLLGFFISIFFPTLYAISIEGLGKNTAMASGLLTMGFLGAALLPVLQGKMADWLGLKYSFIVSIATYSYVLFFALRNLRNENRVFDSSNYTEL